MSSTLILGLALSLITCMLSGRGDFSLELFRRETFEESVPVLPAPRKLEKCPTRRRLSSCLLGPAANSGLLLVGESGDFSVAGDLERSGNLVDRSTIERIFRKLNPKAVL